MEYDENCVYADVVARCFIHITSDDSRLFMIDFAEMYSTRPHIPQDN